MSMTGGYSARSKKACLSLIRQPVPDVHWRRDSVGLGGVHRRLEGVPRPAARNRHPGADKWPGVRQVEDCGCLEKHRTPNLMAAIPVYASVDHIHDHVVQAKGAF